MTRPLVRDIVSRASFHTGVACREIEGSGRSQYQVRPRLAAYWTGVRSGISATTLGRRIGDRDHTTVLHGVRRAEHLRDTDPAFRALTDRLLAEFSGEK